MLRRLITRQLTFPNSPEATRFINSLTGSPLHRRRHHFPVKFLPSNYSFVKSKTSSASSAAVTRNRAAAADMDSTPMTASVTEDFVHVDSGTGNSNSEGLSESSVVKEQGVEEAISAIVEGEREGFERKVLPEELARSASSEEASVVEERGVEEAIAAIEGGEGEGYVRKELPEALLRSVMMLNCDSSTAGGVCDVYVVGSEASVVEERGFEEVILAIIVGEGYSRKVLLEDLSRSPMMLNCVSSTDGGICDVYESCQDVEAVINFLRPEVVFLELCSGRVGVLTPQNLKEVISTLFLFFRPLSLEGEGLNGDGPPIWFYFSYLEKHEVTDNGGLIHGTNDGRNGGDVEEKSKSIWDTLQLVSCQGMSIISKVASKLEVFPGAEFRVAYEEAMKYGGKVILGDRPVQVTLRRTWAKMPLWHKTKLVYSLLFQAVFLPKPDDLVKMLKEMDDVDMLTLVIQEMSKKFPTLMDTLVHERDQFMSSMLLKIAREHNSVVAVVGKGHLPGIKKNWQQPIEVKELLSMPSPKPLISVAKIVATFGVAVAGVAIISGIYISSKK
ncbi:putative traB domain-containing protein-like isoform 2 [Capsicum annuum]|nr:putative traB domain-containing protein-like isoform 2 [Capsicum annuum]KAF3632657.1 putative traB domain-containing protein-like isoform 2 [Capsicum annuum]